MKSVRTRIRIRRINRNLNAHFRRPHGVPVPRVHALHSESVPEEGADLRASVDFREGGGLRHGQVRQEARQGQLATELRDALPHRDRVSVQVRQITTSLVHLPQSTDLRAAQSNHASISLRSLSSSSSSSVSRFILKTHSLMDTKSDECAMCTEPRKRKGPKLRELNPAARGPLFRGTRFWLTLSAIFAARSLPFLASVCTSRSRANRALNIDC